MTIWPGNMNGSAFVDSQRSQFHISAATRTSNAAQFLTSGAFHRMIVIKYSEERAKVEE